VRPDEHRRSLWTWLFNPFVYVAGAKSLLIGVVVILVAGFISSFNDTRLGGTLDLRPGQVVPLWFSLSRGIVGWLSLALVLFIFGKLISKTSFRTVDILGTQALAHWPMLLIGLAGLFPPSRHILEYSKSGVVDPDVLLSIGVGKVILGSLTLLSMLPATCLMIALMYKSYAVSCNVRGGKAIATFIVGLIVARVLAIAVTIGVWSHVG